jgi:ABC-type branched-subunit amino acid transport system permease subunit
MKLHLFIGIAGLVIFVLFPVLNLFVPPDNPFHISAFGVTLGGKIMCYMIVAIAMDLVWGYAGILSLGHGLFFALGGYAMGMYLMRQIRDEGQYRVSWCSSTGRNSRGRGGTAIASSGACSSSSRCRDCLPSSSATSPSARA